MIQTEQLTQQQTLHARGICVLIPTYNNEGTIESVVRECCQQCNDVIVVHSVQVFMNQQYQLIWENPEFYLQWKKRWGQCEDDPNP